MSVAVVSKNPWKSIAGPGDRNRDANGYRTRAVGVAFRGEKDSRQVLLVSSGSLNTSWSVPGGGVEKDETHEEAAVRELLEEAGVTAKATELVGVISDELKKNHTSIFLMEVSEEHSSWQEGLLGRRREWHLVLSAMDFLQEKHRKVLNMALEHGTRL